MPRSTPSNAGTLRLIVPGESAGRLIGRHGSRIQEVQLRSGARVQISDRGEEEKLVEVFGSCDSIGEAASHILNDLARSRPSKNFIENQSTVMEVSVGVLVPEALFGWVMGKDGYESPLAIKGMSMAPSGTYDGDAERRVLLLGAPNVVARSLRILGLRLRRHARWVTSGATELPWEVCDEREDGDPEDGHFSTLNLRLLMLDAVAADLGAGKENSALLTQVQEDTGAAIRVQTLPAEATAVGRTALASSMVEIAGCYSAKLRALLEVSSFLMLLASQKTASAKAVDIADAATDAERSPHCLLEMLFPASGLGALKPDEAVQVNEGRASGAEVSTKRRGRDMLVRIKGTRAGCCTTAVALARAAERRAANHESIHGPPPLLIDYLVRWFGGDSKRWPQAAIAAQAAAAAIAAGKRRPPSKLGLVARRPQLQEVTPTEIASATAVSSTPMGPEAAPTSERSRADPPPADAPAVKRGLKRKKRNAHLSNPFKAARGEPPEIAAARAPAADSALELSDAAVSGAAGAAGPAAVALVAGYSDEESEAELIPEAEPGSDDETGGGSFVVSTASGLPEEKGDDDGTDSDVVVEEVPEGPGDEAAEEPSNQAESPDHSRTLQVCGDCKTLAESGAVDPEDGIWYCRACWTELGRPCPEGEPVVSVPAPAASLPPVDPASDPLFEMRQALLAKLARVL